MDHRDYENFKKIIRKLRERKQSSVGQKEGLTANQIANLVFGKADGMNISIVTKTLSSFKDYFYPRLPNQWTYIPNWDAITKDHPQLFDNVIKPPLQTDISTFVPYQELIDVVSEESNKVYEKVKRQPIWIERTDYLLNLSSEGEHIYEGYLLDEESIDMSYIPEGVDIILQWTNKEIGGTLLAWDGLKNSIIFITEAKLSSYEMQNSYTIIPDLVRLFKALCRRLVTAREKENSIVSKLFRGKVNQLNQTWNGDLFFGNLDESQKVTSSKTLQQDLSVIWGPPGTGKTHTLGNIITNLALGGKKVLAVSIANVAVDNIAKATVDALKNKNSGKELLESGGVLRFGHAKLIEVLREDKLFPNRLEAQKIRHQLVELLTKLKGLHEKETQERALLNKKIGEARSALRSLTKESINSATVVLTTATQVYIEPSFEDMIFDAVVIDEASMMSIPHLVAVGSFAKEYLIVAGDSKQLSPIAISRSEKALKWLPCSVFELLAKHQTGLTDPLISMLIFQRRMHPEISDCINEIFYSGKLRNCATEHKIRARSLEPFPGISRILINTRAEKGLMSFQAEQTPSNSRLNKDSARLSFLLARNAAVANRDMKIAIITPYRSQVRYIRKLLQKLDYNISERTLIGTIHAYQGSEADIVIWDLVDSINLPVGQLYRGEAGDRMANVAISRAQGKLIIIGDPSVFRESQGARTISKIRLILSKYFDSAEVSAESIPEWKEFKETDWPKFE